ESTGKELWTYDHECPYTMAATYATGPRATAAIDGNRVYSLGAEGHLACLNFEDGKVVWSKELRTEYKLATPIWGFSSHPLIDGDRLYLMVGGKGSSVVAFDKHTGKELWRALNAKEAGYAPPMIGSFDGTRQLVAWTGDELAGLGLKNGEVAWTVPAPSQFAMSIGLPKPKNNLVWLMCFNRKAWLVKVSENGTLADVEWEGDSSHGINGVMNTPFVLGDHAYGCGPDGRYICARLSDGKHEWSTLETLGIKRPISWGNVFTVRHKDRFFLSTDLGDLVIARLSPEGYQEISRAHLIEPNHEIGMRKVVWSHPAFANKSVYLRNEGELRCYSLAK
ncbi:MAG: PQQ-binding-like beta-propeller repeat protein, partial [Planctomycetota bacterium]